jgi:S1-C subfamily serine protease
MRIIIFFFLVIGFNSTVFCQDFKVTSQSNDSLSFQRFLSGVKYAEVLMTAEQEELMQSSPMAQSVVSGVLKYLRAMKFMEVGLTSEFLPRQIPSLCEKAGVSIDYRVDDAYINDFSITFYSCDGEWWQFKSSSPILNDGWALLETKVYNRLRRMNSYSRTKYDKSYSRKLPSENTVWNEVEIKEYLKSNRVSPIEGIYEGTTVDNLAGNYKVGVVKEGQEYIMVYLEGALNYEDWNKGEIKARLIETGNPALFKLIWKTRDKSIDETPFASFDLGLMNIKWPASQAELFIKIYPTESDNIGRKTHSSGTGFAISTEGYIVTNQHVIEHANEIIVRGINGDFSKSYSAETIVADRSNDIAIIKINDPKFTSLEQPPYLFDNNQSEVGSTVYALGYPLPGTMGEEVKVTNGIISSKTGFQGDVTSYQISVPVQPGNSGGPLINEKGEIIGIVRAKHLEAENASYAVKTSYILSLIQVMDVPPELPNGHNSLESKNLVDQVKSIKRFVYLLEVN